MKWLRFPPPGVMVLLVLMGLYSLVLLSVELRSSQEQVRPYFTDIEGPVVLYAINTSLSTFLLWACALIFGVVLLVIRGAASARQERQFCLSQIVIFGYLGADDRFLLHERLSDVVPLHDTLILVLVGVLEVAALGIWGRLKDRSVATRCYLFLASVLFLVMAAIDAFAPSELVLRLSCEDLSKAWSTLFLFLFSWHILESHVMKLKAAAR